MTRTPASDRKDVDAMNSKRKKIILNVVLALCIVVVVFCVVKIVQSVYEYQNADKIYSDLTNSMTPPSRTTTEPTNTAAPQNTTSDTALTSDPNSTEPSDTEITQPAPVPKEAYREWYEQLSAMKESYPDFFGWIYIEFSETETISLPVMKGEDNSYYIDHAYDGTASTSGAIFADFRNTDRRITLNQNILLYGHNMNNHSMFNLISSRYKKQNIFNTVPIVFYSMEGMYTFNVFSVYNAKAGVDDFDTIGFVEGDLQKFCLEKQTKSFYTKKLTFDNVQTIITLVTCLNYSDDGRVIVHGVLDSYESYFN